MSSYAEPKLLTFKAAGAISQGMVVKPGADKSHVAKATAATDKSIGLAYSASGAAEDAIEVALPGGGGKGLLGGSVSFGDLLAADSNGKLVTTTTANDRIVAVAMEDGVADDLVSVHVILGNY